MTPLEVSKKLNAISNRIKPEVLKAEKSSNTFLLKSRIALSSGPYKLRTLRRMGYPYAVRNPRPPMDPGIINVQTGVFRRSWRKSIVSVGGNITMKVYNIDPKSRYMAGTSVMIERPVQRIALKPVMKQRKINLEHAIRTALK